MIKLIVIDDEYLVRERIKVCLDWQEIDCEIVGEAANGQDALELVNQLNPDICIVDIDMPFMNGLDFSKIVKMKHPLTKVVILSGYNDFEYARVALQAGVTHYLLKPFNKDELKKIIIELAGMIRNQALLKEHLETLQLNYKESSSLLKEKFIQALIENKEFLLKKENEDKLKLFCPALIYSSVLAAVVDIDALARFANNESEKSLWRFAVSNIFSEVLAKKFTLEASYDVHKKIILLVNISGETQLNEFISLCDEARSYIKLRLRFTVTVGVGRVQESLNQLGTSYKEAVTAYRNKLLLGQNSTIIYHNLEKNTHNIAINTDHRQQLLFHLRAGNMALIRQELHEIFSDIVERNLLIDHLYLVLSELILTVTTFAQENEIQMVEIAGADFTIVEIMELKETVEEVETWFENLFQAVLNIYNKSKFYSYTKMIDKVKKYIDENYTNKDISLDTIAANISINPSYLSNIFKKEAGLSITEYLMKRRMKVAKEQMDNGNKKLFEIAYYVGFNDPYYFSKCFKKMFGVSPSIYYKGK